MQKQKGLSETEKKTLNVSYAPVHVERVLANVHPYKKACHAWTNTGISTQHKFNTFCMFVYFCTNRSRQTNSMIEYFCFDKGFCAQSCTCWSSVAGLPLCVTAGRGWWFRWSLRNKLTLRPGGQEQRAETYFLLLCPFTKYMLNFMNIYTLVSSDRICCAEMFECLLVGLTIPAALSLRPLDILFGVWIICLSCSLSLSSHAVLLSEMSNTSSAVFVTRCSTLYNPCLDNPADHNLSPTSALTDTTNTITFRLRSLVNKVWTVIHL